MPAVKLNKLENYKFSYTIEVRITDLNHGNHVGGAEMIGILNTARSKMFQELGVREDNLGDGKTRGFLKDFVINYIGEAFLHDKLEIMCHVDEIESKTFRIFYCVKKSNKTIALAESGIIGFDYEDKKTSKIPDVLKKGLI